MSLHRGMRNGALWHQLLCTFPRWLSFTLLSRCITFVGTVPSEGRERLSRIKTDFEMERLFWMPCCMDCYVHLWLCFLFFFPSSNIDLSSKLRGNKFVPNLLVQQCFVTFFFKNPQTLVTETVVSHDLGKSSYALACPLSGLFTLALHFFTSCKLRPQVLCSTDSVIVCALCSAQWDSVPSSRGGF